MFRRKLNFSVMCRVHHSLLSYTRPNAYIYVVEAQSVFTTNPWKCKWQDCFVLFLVLGFELRALHLLGRCSTT
jgi:hypothetical protein